MNSGVAALTGNSKVDAIFNAHSHSEYTQDSLGIPIMQSGSNGEFIGHLRFILQDGVVIGYSMDNLTDRDSDLLKGSNDTVQALIDTYVLETEALFNTYIITSEDDFNKYELTDWLAELMRVTTNSDIAFHNSGGTRTDISDGESINLGVLYAIWPFDNIVKTVMLTGSQITAFMATGDGSNYHTIIDTFEPDTLYKVATNDYVFDKPTNPFISGENIINTGLLLRDIAEDELILQSYVYSFFNITNDILSSSLVPPSSSPIYDESTD